jgi:hypothetical protein
MSSNFTAVTMMLGDNQKNQLSDAVRGDGYYGYRDGYHTLSVVFQQFLGRIQIEATLELNPTENDWFPVWLTGTTPYKQYSDPKTGSEAFTFQGNFVLLRFRKMRSYLPSSYSSVGDISKVMLSI